MAGGLTICTEVQKRLGGRFAITDILPYANRIMNLVVACGPHHFLHQTPTQITVSNSLFDTTSGPTANLDIGKPVHLFHTTGVPIPKISSSESTYTPTASSTSGGYFNVGSGLLFNGWFWFGTGGISGPKINFIPFVSGSSNVLIDYYWVAPMALANNDTALTPWTPVSGSVNQLTWLDDIVIEGTEMEIKRVSNYIGWDLLEARFKAKLAEVKQTFSSERENTGSIPDNQVTEMEKTSMGRV